MSRYDRYKDSGVKWIGEIPSHWEVGKMREFFSEKKELSKDGTEKLLSVSEYTGITPSTNEEGENISRSKSLIGYKKCSVSDLVINIMLAWKRGLAISPFNGIVSPSYCVFSTKGLNPNFANYLLRTDLYIAEFKRNSTGIIESRLRMYPDDFKNIQCIKPPLGEQEAIVAYLDKETGDIDKAIEAQQKLIEALNERKQIIITNAVTKGLNPEAPLKDSGIDWLGQIPEHWEIRRLKWLISGSMQYGANESPDEFSESLPRYIRITDISKEGKLKKEGAVSLSERKAKKFLLDKGDILFARSGATVGKTFLFNEDFSACFAGYLIRIKCNSNMVPEFLLYFTQSSVYENWKNYIFNKATIQNIGADKYITLSIPLPIVSEQKEIVKFINDKISPLNAQTTNCEKMISLLLERKQIIINDVVTGKKKVI